MNGLLTMQKAKRILTKNYIINTGNDKVTELLRCLAVLWLSLAFAERKI